MAAWRRGKAGRALRRNRALLITLLVAAGVCALMSGTGVANLGFWSTHHSGFDGPLPPNRFGMASAYDRINKEILIFGGFGEGPPAVAGAPPLSVVALDQTWGQNMARGNAQGAMWTNRNPVHHPSARGFASMAFDVARNNMVLFGGAPYRSNAVSGETWTWDGIDWTLREPPGDRPPARQNASMTYDAHRRNVVMFGGRGANGGNLRDTWIWDGAVWTKIETGTGNADAPRASHSSAMSYDICRGQAVLFGGIESGRNSAAVQTWTWDGAKWTNSTPFVGVQGANDPSNSPTSRYGAAATYSYRSGRVLLYGGFYASDNLFAQVSDIPVATDESVWSWDGAVWRKETLNPSNTAFYGLADSHEHSIPTPRAYALFAFGSLESSSTGSKISLFGGIREDPNSAAPPLFNNDHHHYREDLIPQASPVLGGQSCINPVPLPPEQGTAKKDQGSGSRKIAVREEIREIAQLPVLVGTEWPSANRNPKIGNNPNPSYTPPPDCPRRTQESPQNTHLMTDPKRNRVYQFFICESAQPKILIEAYDGNTNPPKPIGSALASIPINLPYGTTFSDMFVHDIDRGRFLIRVQTYSGTGNNYNNDLWVIQQDLIGKGFDPVVKKYPLPPPPPPQQVQGLTVSSSAGQISEVGLFNHPKTGRAKALLSLTGSNSVSFITQNSNSTSTPPKVAQWDLESNTKDWEAPVAACLPNFVLTRGYRGGESVYTACQISGDGNTGQYAVVRIPVTEGAGGEVPGAVEMFPGPNNVRRTWFDPHACRLLLQSDTFQPDGSSLWVWDCESSRYVGRVGLAQTGASSWNAGFDEETGRWYLLVPDHKAYDTSIDTASNIVQGGLLVVDTRLTPVPQAVNFTQYSYPSYSARIGILPSGSGIPRRVFMRRTGGSMQRYPDGGTVSLPNEMHYKVLADDLPIPQQPESEQLDALTIPVIPSDKTEVSFDAEGSAYGLRLRRVGGIFTLSGSTDPPCFHPDRELKVGWVAQAQLSDLTASVRSLALDADSATKQDIQSPGSRCLIPQDALDFAGQGPAKQTYEETLYPLLRETLPQVENQIGPELDWSKHFEASECVGDSANVSQVTGTDVYGSSTCSQRDARVEGVARGSALGLAAAGISVAENGSKVVINRDLAKGVVVTATAWATGIKLGPLTIERVETKAVSWSNGRPHEEPRAEFSRLICGFHTPDGSVPGCLTSQQQKDNFARWNSGWGARSQITIPTPDQTLLQGTPGGYLAGVTKPLAEQEEEKLFVNDSHKEVIGLRITFNPTNAAVSPQILDLAAVRAVTVFGVQCGSEFIYSPSANNCVPLPEDVLVEEEFEDEESFEEVEESEFDSGEWTPSQALGTNGERSLGSRIGNLLKRLPVIRSLPVRQMSEALLGSSVWLLLFSPLGLASRRFALSAIRKV